MFKKVPKYKWFLVTGDYLVLILSFYLALTLTELGEPARFNWHASNKLYYTIFYISFSGLQILYFHYSDLYKIKNLIVLRKHLFLLLKSTLFSLFGLIIINFIVRTNVDSRMFYGLLYLVTFVCLFIFHVLFIYMLRQTSLLSERVIIIGAGSKGKSILKEVLEALKIKKAIGFIDDNYPIGTQIEGLPVLGAVNQLNDIAVKQNVKTLVLAINDINRKRFFELLALAQEQKLTLAVSSNYLNVLYDKISLDQYENHDVVRFGSLNQSLLLKSSKRLFDVFFSLVGLILLSPLFFAMALIVKFTSKGPVFYSQIRIGKNGKPFKFYKFRSMKINSDKDKDRAEKVVDFIKGNGVNNGTTKIVNSQNITKFGKFIRKTSLDELPQLINVLIGDMSLVGPRPCIKREWDAYEDWQKQRLMVLPGCTGIWQVCGRSKVNFEETVLMDIYYNHNVSIWMDIKIILMTIPVILFGKGGQ